MALNYTQKTKPIMDGDEVVAHVHGLSFNAMVGLINMNREVVEGLFNSFQGRDVETISEQEVMGVGMEMITKAPVFVAQIIAQASDAYDGYDPKDEGAINPMDIIMGMPVGLQLAFLQEIGPLTFSAGGGAKKMIALAMQAAQGGRQSAG